MPVDLIYHEKEATTPHKHSLFSRKLQSVAKFMARFFKIVLNRHSVKFSQINSSEKIRDPRRNTILQTRILVTGKGETQARAIPIALY